MKKLLLAFAFIAISFNAEAKIQEIKTPGGFTVWLVEEHSLPIINMHVAFSGSGTAYDTEAGDGRTNMVASLLMEGAGERNSQSFNEALEENAIHMNIAADDDALHATLQTLTDNKDIAFSMFADALTRPRFDADAVERARSKMQVLLVEQESNPGAKLSRAFQESMFGAHPYARLGIGTKESLEKLSANDFKSYVANYLTRENIVISVVGDITPADISAIVDKDLGALPAHYAPDSKLADIEIPATPDKKIIDFDIPQSMVAFGLPGLKRSDPDFIAAYVMNYIIGGSGLNSLLAQEIRVKRGLAYTVRSQLEPKIHAAIWRGMFSTRNEQVENAITALQNTLSDYAKNTTTQPALDDAKAFLTGSFVLDLSSNDEVASFITMMQMQHLGIDYMEKRNDLMNAVTLADIKRVSARLIKPENLRIVIVGKPEKK